MMFVGWDVGGWNCEKNSSSRDAITILDAKGKILGKPWRGNLRDVILSCADAGEFSVALAKLCNAIPNPVNCDPAVLAIDAPLAFPDEFVKLLMGSSSQSRFSVSARNPYLYRYTEMRLCDEGVQPLSSVKDMIGSQSTKAIHVINSLFPMRKNTGVWTAVNGMVAIETYPSLCRRRAAWLMDRLPPQLSESKQDIIDSWICAEVARTFGLEIDKLEAPTREAPSSEGWIWAWRPSTP